MRLSDSLGLLSRHGIRTSGRLVTEEEALDMPRPLVLKADTAAHKTDEGLLFVGLKTDGEIRDAYRQLEPHGVVAQPVLPGFEFAVGALEDPTFGPVVMLGMGGTKAELFRDTTFRAVPISREDALEMTNELRVSPVFDGFRGCEPSREAVAGVLVRLSEMAGSVSFKEVDVNPLMVEGDRAVAVDARVIE